MEPSITNISETNNLLAFTLKGVNVSIANGLRRVSSEIPSIVFRTSPHEANKAVFEVNTTRMNNELIKQRLSCVPIYADVSDFPLDKYMLVVKKQNNSTSIEYVTTADFQIMNLETKQYDKELSSKMFPPNSLTGDYPELVRLLPKVSDDIEGEQLVLTCKFDVGTTKEDSAFNITSTFVYSNTIDPAKVKAAWAEKKTELSKTLNADEMAFAEKDWNLLDAQRHFMPDSFDFKVETVGQISNREIITRSANMMISKLEKLKDTIQSEQGIITTTESTIPNCFDILLKNEDYTLGKAVEFVLYNTHYDNTIHYCGFRKPHPHIDESLIRLGFKSPTDKVTVSTYIVNAADDLIKVYTSIGKVFEITK
jgi:DNA-directed RNA polymerase subunit L